LRYLLATTAVLLFSAARADAVIVLDQEYDPAPFSVAAITAPPGYDYEDKAQTFTVGVSGILTRVEVLITFNPVNFGPLSFDVRKAAGGAPTSDLPASNILATALIPNLGVSTNPTFAWAAIDGLSIPVIQGDQLAIVLQNNAGGGFAGWRANVNGYAAGGLYTRSNTNPSTNPEPPLEQ